jgi:hypothetical protein
MSKRERTILLDESRVAIGKIGHDTAALDQASLLAD